MESAFVHSKFPVILMKQYLKCKSYKDHPSSYLLKICSWSSSILWVEAVQSFFHRRQTDQAILLGPVHRKNYSSFQTQLLSILHSFNCKLPALFFIIVQWEKYMFLWATIQPDFIEKPAWRSSFVDWKVNLKLKLTQKQKFS